MLSSPGSNSPVMKVSSKRPVLINQPQGVTFKNNFIFRKHRWKFLYGVSYGIVPFSLLCVGTGVDCTCFAEINSVQNSCIVIGTEEPKYVHVTLCYVMFRIFNSFQINTDWVLYSFVHNLWSRKEQNIIFHIHKLRVSVLFTCAVCWNFASWIWVCKWGVNSSFDV